MPKLDDTLDDLMSKYGHTGVSKKHGTEYRYIDKHERQEVIRHLVQTLKDHGQVREVFSQSAMRDVVAGWVFPQALVEFWDKDKRRRAFESVWKELKYAVADIYSKPEDTSEAPKRDVVITEKAQNPKPEPKVEERELTDADRATGPQPSTVVNEEMADFFRIKDE